MTPEEFAVAADVPRETLQRLMAMDAVLMDWTVRHNLVARSTLPERWSRHYLDSIQIAKLLPAGVKTLVDMGSGAGFPGLVLAAVLEGSGAAATLIESTGKKAAFLAEAGRAMGLTRLSVRNERIESVRLDFKPEIITARALARLDKLLAYGFGMQGKSTRYFLPKGQDVEGELTEASKYWHMSVIRHPSLTSPDGTILEIADLGRAS